MPRLDAVYMHDYFSPMDDDLTQCLVLNTRMAARAVTRRYDKALRPFGITAAQFSILTSMVARPERSVTDMARSIAIDRTTLSRNLDLLVRKGLVSGHEADKGNGRLVALTNEGNDLVQKLLPQWRQAQAEMRELLVAPDLKAVVASLQKLSQV